MPQVITDQTIVGEALHAWTVQEFEHHERHRRWHVLMGVLGVLCIVYGLWTANYLFPFIIILFGIILYFQSHQQPPQVPFAITEVGVVIGNRLYDYGELDSFYFVYQPPEVKMLYIEPKKAFHPLLRIPLLDENPLDIQATLAQFLPEDLEKEEEPVSDRIARDLQLH